jgi:hypothetical protein
VPRVIGNGCDVFLFCTDADIRRMEHGLRHGALVRDQLKWVPVKCPITHKTIESITFIGFD